MIWFTYNAPSIVCAIGAVLLALNGKDGWGWFLLVSAGLHTTAKVHDKKTEEKNA